MKREPVKETLLAFVDEIGDRGHSRKSSEYFAMSAVIFPIKRQSQKTTLNFTISLPLLPWNAYLIILKN